MLKELSSMNYGYENVVEGCYDTAINNRGYVVPIESKESIVELVITILNE